MQFSIIHSQYK